MLNCQISILRTESKLLTLSLVGKTLAVVQLCTCGLQLNCSIEVPVGIIKLKLAHEHIGAVEEIF